MKKYIGCDANARYSVFASIGKDRCWDSPVRVEHNELEMERFLKQLPAGSGVAIETSGNWHWRFARWKKQVWNRSWRMPWKRRSACRGGTRPTICCQGPGVDAAQRLSI